MLYHPKRDWWVAIVMLIIGAIQLTVACLMVVAAIRMDQPGILVPATVVLTVAMFLFWIWSASSYEISEHDLEIFSTRRLKADLGWGLAWSLDRVRIKARGRLLPFWISPDDKAGFISELVRVRPGLKVIEDR